MNWNNLKKNKCPKCSKDFGFRAFSKPDIIECPSGVCNFSISHKRFSEIVNSQVSQDLDNFHNQQKHE